MNKFKVGDRVIAYTYSGTFTGVVTVSGDEDVEINSGDRYLAFHHKQCRRLKKNEQKAMYAYSTYIPDGGDYTELYLWDEGPCNYQWKLIKGAKRVK